MTLSMCVRVWEPEAELHLSVQECGVMPFRFEPLEPSSVKTGENGCLPGNGNSKFTHLYICDVIYTPPRCLNSRLCRGRLFFKGTFLTVPL